MELTKLSDVMRMIIRCSGKEMDFDLPEVCAAERREESRTLLFSIWDSLEATKTKLQAGKVYIGTLIVLLMVREEMIHYLARFHEV